jgi:hypothetical protein
MCILKVGVENKDVGVVEWKFKSKSTRELLAISLIVDSIS